jgi:hypothetical protein
MAAGVLLALALLTVATQLTSLQREVINWDESTFMLMAQDLLRGHLPYTSLFDNKPPLVFFVIAGVFAVFGQSLEAVRWFGDACIFATAAMVFGMLRGRAGTKVAALVAALFVAAHVPDFGLFTSSEIIANVPLTAALWVLLDRGERGWGGGSRAS